MEKAKEYKKKNACCHSYQIRNRKWPPIGFLFASLFLFLALFCLFGEFPPTTAFCVTRGSSLSYTYLARLFPCRSINHLTAQQSSVPRTRTRWTFFLFNAKVWEQPNSLSVQIYIRQCEGTLFNLNWHVRATAGSRINIIHGFATTLLNFETKRAALTTLLNLEKDTIIICARGQQAKRSHRATTRKRSSARFTIKILQAALSLNSVISTSRYGCHDDIEI